MDGRQLWTDFHFLNDAFRNVSGFSSNGDIWIDSHVVRASYKTNADSGLNRSVRNINGLVMEYGSPFPLYYIFHQRALESYNSILVLLIQIRRAKTSLDNILIRGINDMHRSKDLKTLYATRGRLSWFVK